MTSLLYVASPSLAHQPPPSPGPSLSKNPVGEDRYCESKHTNVAKDKIFFFRFSRKIVLKHSFVMFFWALTFFTLMESVKDDL